MDAASEECEAAQAAERDAQNRFNMDKAELDTFDDGVFEEIARRIRRIKKQIVGIPERYEEALRKRSGAEKVLHDTILEKEMFQLRIEKVTQKDLVNGSLHDLEKTVASATRVIDRLSKTRMLEGDP